MRQPVGQLYKAIFTGEDDSLIVAVPYGEGVEMVMRIMASDFPSRRVLEVRLLDEIAAGFVAMSPPSQAKVKLPRGMDECMGPQVDLSEDPCDDRPSSLVEPVFVLKARDELAPSIVRAWASEAEDRGVAAVKVKGARQKAEDMIAWQRQHGHKLPT